MAKKIKKGDLVEVITGSKAVRGGDRGKQGYVLAIAGERVWVEGVNLTTRHKKRTTSDRGSRSGGIEKKESPVHVSNIALVDPETKTPTKVGIRLKEVNVGGTTKTVRVRFAKKSGKELA